MAFASRLALVGVALVVGCASDRDPPPQASGSSSSTSASSTGSESTETGAAESTGPGWPLPTEDDRLTCVSQCEGPWDCCPPNSAGLCPGPAYPYNFMCIEGLCVAPPCEGDDDCDNEGERCLTIEGAPRCRLPCTDDDAPCMAANPDHTCSGVDDAGQAFCFAHCSTPSVFCGNAQCDESSGHCLCESSGQCLSGWDCV